MIVRISCLMGPRAKPEDDNFRGWWAKTRIELPGAKSLELAITATHIYTEGRCELELWPRG